jgi:hypothetical protein
VNPCRPVSLVRTQNFGIEYEKPTYVSRITFAVIALVSLFGCSIQKRVGALRQVAFGTRDLSVGNNALAPF